MMIELKNKSLIALSPAGFLAAPSLALRAWLGMTARFLLQEVVSGGFAAADNFYALYDGSSFRMERSGMRNLLHSLT